MSDSLQGVLRKVLTLGVAMLMLATWRVPAGTGLNLGSTPPVDPAPSQAVS